MDARIVTVNNQKMLVLSEEMVVQAGLLEEVVVEVTEDGLLIRPRTLSFEEALQQVLTDHNDMLRSLAER